MSSQNYKKALEAMERMYAKKNSSGDTIHLFAQGVEKCKYWIREMEAAEKSNHEAKINYCKKNIAEEMNDLAMMAGKL